MLGAKGAFMVLEESVRDVQWEGPSVGPLLDHLALANANSSAARPSSAAYLNCNASSVQRLHN